VDGAEEVEEDGRVEAASIMMMGRPKLLSASLRDGKETTDTCTENMDYSLTRVHNKVDSSSVMVMADKLNDIQSGTTMTQFGSMASGFPDKS
jgi:hypothetical protein